MRACGLEGSGDWVFGIEQSDSGRSRRAVGGALDV